MAIKKYWFTIFAFATIIIAIFLITPKSGFALEKNTPVAALVNREIPLNTPLSISGMDQNGTRRGFVNVGPFASWDYAYLRLNDNSHRFIFEQGSSNMLFRIRAQLPNWGTHNYFNISQRGYVYLDRRENAREFIIEAQASGGFKFFDAQTRQELGIFSWEGFYYVTTGTGTIPINWLVF